MKAQRGFTLVELMVSLVVFSFVVVGVLAVAVSMTNGYRDQRESTSNEGLVRIPMDFLGDVLRQASPAVPTYAIYNAASGTCALPDAGLKVTNTNPDTLEVTYASGGVVTETSGSTTFSSGTSVSIVNTAGFAHNDWVVISNLSQGHLFQINTIAGNTLNFYANVCSSLGAGYPPGSTVVRAQHAVFSVGAIPGETGGPTALLMTTNGTTEPVADNIEDMQIAVAIDANGDGLISSIGSAGDDDEWVFNATGDSAPTSWPPTGTIRALRISLVARSLATDVGNAQAFRRPLLEDRAQGALDNYRRRVLKTTIEFRNGGISP